MFSIRPHNAPSSTSWRSVSERDGSLQAEKESMNSFHRFSRMQEDALPQSNRIIRIAGRTSRRGGSGIGLNASDVAFGMLEDDVEDIIDDI